MASLTGTTDFNKLDGHGYFPFKKIDGSGSLGSLKSCYFRITPRVKVIQSGFAQFLGTHSYSTRVPHAVVGGSTTFRLLRAPPPSACGAVRAGSTLPHYVTRTLSGGGVVRERPPFGDRHHAGASVTVLVDDELAASWGTFIQSPTRDQYTHFLIPVNPFWISIP